MRALEGHRASLLDQDERQGEGEREEHVCDDPPHVDEEVADRRLAAHGADDGRQAQKPIDAERKKFAEPKKIWLKFEKCWSPE